MRHVGRNLLAALCFFSLALGASLAAAAGTTPTPANAPLAVLLTPWLPLIVATIGLLATVLRSWSPSSGFLHTFWGHTIITLGGGLLGSLGGALQQSGFDKAAIITAIASAVAAFAGAFKPVGTQKSQSQTGTGASTAALILFFVLGSLMLPSCACSKPELKDSPQCKVLNIAVACGEPASLNGLGALVAAVLPAIVGSQINWTSLVPVEEHYGTNAIMCALAYIGNLASGASLPVPATDGMSQAIALIQANRDNIKTNVEMIFKQRHVTIVVPRA